MTGNECIDMVERDGVFRRRRPFRERAAEAEALHEAAWRLFLMSYMPALMIGRTLAWAGVAVTAVDMGTGALLVVLGVAIGHRLPTPPKWDDSLAKVPKFE